MVESVTVQIILGIYLGILTGIIPALISWSMGFSFKYFTGFSVPGFGVVVLAAALAGVSGGLMGLLDPAISSTWTGITALLIVLMMALWAHGHGDLLGETFPRRITIQSLRDRTLSSDVIDRIGNLGQVKIRVRGPVKNLEDYPPLPDQIRQQLADDSWTFPASLSISEMEQKLYERLLSSYDLADLVVSIDDGGNATIAAAPAPGGLSRRLPPGKRAISIEVNVPAGTANGDVVTIFHREGKTTGTVLGASVEEPKKSVTDQTDAFPQIDQNELAERVGVNHSRNEEQNRLTVSVSLQEARTLLTADIKNLCVQSRGIRQVYDLISTLKEAGYDLEKVSVDNGSEIAGITVGGGKVRETFGVGILAIKRSTTHIVAPSDGTAIHVGDILYLCGTRKNLDRIATGEIS